MPGFISEPSVLGFPALVLVGALLNLDRRVLGTFLVGRPLMTGFILGLAAGEPVFGVWLGLSAELLWVGNLPLGGQITPHAGQAASAAFIAWILSGFAPVSAAEMETPGVFAQASLVIAFMTIPFWAWIMGLIDFMGRRLNPAILARVRADLALSRDPRLLRRNLYGLAAAFLLSVAGLSAAAALSAQIIRLTISLAPPTVIFNLGFLFNLIPFTGLLGMAALMESRTFPYYLGGLLSSLLVLSAV